MRADQYERLQTLSETLADVFLDEADPKNWPGAGKAPADLSKEERGDRYWSKKNAFATVSLIQRVGGLVALIQDNSNKGVGAAVVDESGRLMDEEINAAEKEAQRLMSALDKATRKKEFDKHVHGKA